MLKPLRLQAGTSLVELMISMVLGFASLTALSSLVAHGIGLNNLLMAKSRLDEELNAVMAVMEQDLKRTGYFGLTKQLVINPSAITNPFAKTLHISSFGSETANSCITFAYDRNNNGQLDKVASNEEFGFRLNNKAVEMRVDGYSCGASYWQDLTDSKMVNVTKLSFSIERLSSLQVATLRVEVELHAQLIKYPELSKVIKSRYVINNYE